MIQLGFSSCPNDTFIFDAMVHSKVDTEGYIFNCEIADVETLNQLAMKGVPDMVKISYHAYLLLEGEYQMLNSGNALGFGVGPLLVSREHTDLSDIQNMTIAIPGEYTTAHLLLNLAFPEVRKKKIIVFHEIEDAVIDRIVDAGVIIHENRFTYEEKGLKKILDLGEYWEQQHQAPIPLGGIAVKRSLGERMISSLERIMHRSVLYAMENPEDVMGFVRMNAQEMDQEIMKKHISLYVNPFTIDLGHEGKRAVEVLFREFKKQMR